MQTALLFPLLIKQKKTSQFIKESIMSNNQIWNHWKMITSKLENTITHKVPSSNHQQFFFSKLRSKLLLFF